MEIDYVESASVWLGKQSVTYHGHLGKPPLEIDAAAQARFESLAQDQPPPGGDEGLGSILIMGEEATPAVGWNPHVPGRVSIFRADPIDGTSSLAHCGDGFASVVTVDSTAQGNRPWRHLAGAIVRSDGLTISWSRSAVWAHHVVLDMKPLTARDVPKILHYGIVPPFVTRDVDEMIRADVSASGATVAAQSAKRREALQEKFPRLQLVSNHLDYRAGTTAAWQLCKGMLGFIVELNTTTIHDSAHLYPFYFLGGQIVTHDLEPVRILEVMQDNAGPESLERVIPPYIAYSNPRSLDLIRRSMGPGKR
ncbi:hypothetical protein AB0K18_37585 [Nonomuraea sp. NPDC049421]|uniref:hypothetical protein n=1 Tax=Nonomuraea sp. NPDC049421 TaxID=3155275 RepID=UPI00343203F5